MLHINVIAVGRLKERFWTDACTEYLKRLKPYADVRMTEIADLDPAKCGGEAKAVEQESAGILAALPKNSYVILCDIGGKTVSSEEIAHSIEALSLDGINDVAIIIGGSCGVDESVRQRADQKWSFGRITLPHNLARVVLLEQVYRAYKIIRHEPYHK